MLLWYLKSIALVFFSLKKSVRLNRRSDRSQFTLKFRDFTSCELLLATTKMDWLIKKCITACENITISHWSWVTQYEYSISIYKYSINIWIFMWMLYDHAACCDVMWYIYIYCIYFQGWLSCFYYHIPLC